MEDVAGNQIEFFRYQTTNLNFSSNFESSGLPNISWSNGTLSYGNKNQSRDSLFFGTNYPKETLYQSYLQKNTQNPNQQTLAPDTIAAATKAITSNPGFQSALVVALSSIIGSGGTNNGTLENQNVIQKSSQTGTATPNGKSCSR